MNCFRVDYCGRGELADRQQKLNQFLSKLAHMAEGSYLLPPLSLTFHTSANTLTQNSTSASSWYVLPPIPPPFHPEHHTFHPTLTSTRRPLIHQLRRRRTKSSPIQAPARSSRVPTAASPLGATFSPTRRPLEFCSARAGVRSASPRYRTRPIARREKQRISLPRAGLRIRRRSDEGSCGEIFMW